MLGEQVGGVALAQPFAQRERSVREPLLRPQPVALEVSAAALTQRFGSIDPDGKIRGFLVTATKSGLLPTVQSGFLADIEPRE